MLRDFAHADAFSSSTLSHMCLTERSSKWDSRSEGKSLIMSENSLFDIAKMRDEEVS